MHCQINNEKKKESIFFFIFVQSETFYKIFVKSINAKICGIFKFSMDKYWL